MFVDSPYKKSILVFTALILCAGLFVTCVGTEQKKEEPVKKIAAPPQFSAFAGTASCMKCHEDIYKKHLETAHFKTSAKANEATVKGPVTTPENTFNFNASTAVRVEKNEGKYVQAEYVDGIETVFAPMHLTIGSGKRGQTFAYWRDESLFQLPLTYFTELNVWSNSPGYANRVVYNRPVTSRCLECHSTYIQKTSAEEAQPETYSNTNIVFGISCEKCHGPAAKHVLFHEQHPAEKKAQFIINPKYFTRTQQLDLCRLCHGGRLNKSAPSFSYVAGDSLQNFFSSDSSNTPSVMDVHGNQFGMMAASKCFQNSKALTCLTCHSPHENEDGKTKLFNSRCMSCHNKADNTFCSLKDALSVSLEDNCINCHMPQQPSRAIMVLLQGNNIPTSAHMYTHLIKVYPEITKKYLLKK